LKTLFLCSASKLDIDFRVAVVNAFLRLWGKTGSFLSSMGKWMLHRRTANEPLRPRAGLAITTSHYDVVSRRKPLSAKGEAQIVFGQHLGGVFAVQNLQQRLILAALSQT
jgi:hypothetical protein